MRLVAAFHSMNEVNKPQKQQVHHNNSSCAPGRDIPAWERLQGSGGYRLCDVCQKETCDGRWLLNTAERNALPCYLLGASKVIPKAHEAVYWLPVRSPLIPQCIERQVGDPRMAEGGGSRETGRGLTRDKHLK